MSDTKSIEKPYFISRIIAGPRDVAQPSNLNEDTYVCVVMWDDVQYCVSMSHEQFRETPLHESITFVYDLRRDKAPETVDGVQYVFPGVCYSNTRVALRKPIDASVQRVFGITRMDIDDAKCVNWRMGDGMRVVTDELKTVDERCEEFTRKTGYGTIPVDYFTMVNQHFPGVIESFDDVLRSRAVVDEDAQRIVDDPTIDIAVLMRDLRVSLAHISDLTDQLERARSRHAGLLSKLGEKRTELDAEISDLSDF